MNFSNILSDVIKKKDLTRDQMTGAMGQIMSGSVSLADTESFLIGLREKGESTVEIAAAAEVLRSKAVHLSKKYPDMLDTCGTGGDLQNTLNVSTLSALVCCAAGARVAKHGNRSVSGICGSADLLEMLGVRVELSASSVERCIQETGFGFFFAPKFHPAMKAVMPVRRNIKGKTLFNLLGPLANPAGADYQLVGVNSRELVATFAEVFLSLGVQRALIVHGLEGLDEISIGGPTLVAEIDLKSVTTYTISPEEFGLVCQPLDSLRCRSKEDNKEAALKILDGKAGPGFDIVCLNAGAALYVAKKTASVKAGYLEAKEMLTSGKAGNKLEQIRLLTQSLE